MNPKVAIIIPSYNSLQYLRQSVESAISQDYDNLDIYIYDNESTDGSYELAKEIAKSNKNVEVIQVQNLYSRSYREAFEHAFENLKFDYISFLASDDFLEPNYVSSYVQIFEKNPKKIKCIQSPICGIQNGIKTGYVSHTYKNISEFKQQCYTKSPVTTPSVMYHKSVYEYLSPKSHLHNNVKFGGAEDYDMYCNLADNNIFIYPVPKFMGYYYRWHENQSTWKVHKQEVDYDKMIKDYWKSKWS